MISILPLSVVVNTLVSYSLDAPDTVQTPTVLATALENEPQSIFSAEFVESYDAPEPALNIVVDEPTPAPTEVSVDCFSLEKQDCKANEGDSGQCVWDRVRQKSCVPKQVDCFTLDLEQCKHGIRIGRCTWHPIKRQCWPAAVPDCPSLSRKKCKVFDLFGDCQNEWYGCLQSKPRPDCSSLKSHKKCIIYEQAGHCVWDRMGGRSCLPAEVNCLEIQDMKQCKALEGSGKCYWHPFRQTCGDGPVPECSTLTRKKCKMFRAFGDCNFDKTTKQCSQLTPLPDCFSLDSVGCLAAQWIGQRCVWDKVTKKLCYPTDLQCDAMEKRACKHLDRIGKCSYDENGNTCSDAPDVDCTTLDKKTCKVMEEFRDCIYDSKTDSCRSWNPF